MTRTTAPFGRRAAPVSAREQHGAYTVIRCLDRTGPAPQPGQFYMLSSSERWGGGEGQRGYSATQGGALALGYNPSPCQG